MSRFFHSLYRFLRIVFLSIYRLVDSGGMELAGNMTFSSFFALTPFVIVLASVASFFGNYSVTSAIGEQELAKLISDLLVQFTPDLARVLGPVVTQLLSAPQTGAFTFGLITSVWVASSAVESARHGLNTAYHITETRMFWMRRAQAILVVLITGGVTFTLLLMLFALPIGVSILENRFDWHLPLARWFNDTRFVIAFCLVFIVMLIFHRYLPNHKYRFTNLIPGVFWSSLVWVITAFFFSYYIQRSLPNYSAVYGSLAGIMICLFFIYLSCVIFLFGGYYNAARRIGKRVT